MALAGPGIVTLLVTAGTKPNIVLIVTDDQGWWDVGSYGNKEIETPNLDRLAAESVELTRFYVQPVCAPTRAGLMTGRHYLRTGVYNTRFGGDTLRPSEGTLAEALLATRRSSPNSCPRPGSRGRKGPHV